jgi:hypothetical protein
MRSDTVTVPRFLDRFLGLIVACGVGRCAHLGAGVGVARLVTGTIGLESEWTDLHDRAPRKNKRAITGEVMALQMVEFAVAGGYITPCASAG